MRVLFDADSMVYGCGFAAQHTVYDYVLIPPEGSDDAPLEGVTESKDELGAMLAMAPEGWTLTYNSVAEAEPLENALALCKRQLNRVEEKLARDGHDFGRLELFITGPGNYRNSIATVRPYKGNRVLMEKPIHYKSIRRYLVNRWMAVTTQGWEADDEVTMISHTLGHDPEKVIIVSQDKDLRTVPGLLYNYRRDTYERITRQQSLVNFYRQVLMGDQTDNIVGCYKVGEAKATKLIGEDMTEQEMWDTCLKEYEASMQKAGCPYAGREAYVIVLETARLLHLARDMRETEPAGYWNPPDAR